MHRPALSITSGLPRDLLRQELLALGLRRGHHVCIVMYLTVGPPHLLQQIPTPQGSIWPLTVLQ